MRACRPLPGGRHLPPGGGAAGSPPARQGGGRLPPIKKLSPFHRTLISCPRDPERGEGERRGEGGNSTGEALPDFESEPQVINISQLL